MMERVDVGALGAQCLADLIALPPDQARSCILRITSGTSGGGPILAATQYDAQAPHRLSGDEQVERMLVCIGSLSARLANVLIARSGPDTQILQVLPLDSQDLEPGLQTLLEDYRPQGMHGFCSFVLHATLFLGAPAASHVVVVKLTGELLSQKREELLRERLPNARQTEIYIAAEVGGSIANRCAYLPRNHFHPMAGVMIELENLDQDGFGDLVISKKLFRARSVSRYRIGDVGRIIQKVCLCGETETLELQGRRGADYIKVAGALLRHEEFDRVVHLFSSYMNDYRVEVGEIVESEILKGRILVRLYWRGHTVTAGLCEEIATNISKTLFMTPTQTYADLVAQGLFVPLTVVYTPVPFAQGYKDNKFSFIS